MQYIYTVYLHLPRANQKCSERGALHRYLLKLLLIMEMKFPLFSEQANFAFLCAQAWCESPYVRNPIFKVPPFQFKGPHWGFYSFESIAVTTHCVCSRLRPFFNAYD